jgi:7-cyano-7-deazaguanine synthase
LRLHPEADVNLLLSGGVDSAGLIAFYLSRGSTVTGIHFNYNQPSIEGERRAVLALTQHYNISFSTIDLGLQIACTNGEYHCRNATLLLTAASIFPLKKGRFAIGIHAGTPYYDCSKAFVEDMQRIFDGYFAGSVQVEAPFIDFSKKEIFKYCEIAKVPMKLTFSCERRGDRPCGECPSCLERKELDENF